MLVQCFPKFDRDRGEVAVVLRSKNLPAQLPNLVCHSMHGARLLSDDNCAM